MLEDVRAGMKFCICDIKRRKKSESVTVNLGTYFTECKDFNLCRCWDAQAEREASTGDLILFISLEQRESSASSHQSGFGYSTVAHGEARGLQGKSAERSEWSRVKGINRSTAGFLARLFWWLECSFYKERIKNIGPNHNVFT